MDDPWWALQLDNAVVSIGIGVENALHERHNVGTKKAPDWQPLYTLEQLLDPAFRLPPSKTAQDKERGAINALKSLVGKGGVKMFKAT
jgi:hypothetical protein